MYSKEEKNFLKKILGEKKKKLWPEVSGCKGGEKDEDTTKGLKFFFVRSIFRIKEFHKKS